MIDKMKLKEELDNFTGSEHYYKSTFGKLKLTDGINYLRNKADCYWFIDIIESYQYKLKKIPFQIWQIKVNADRTAVVTCREDTNEPVIVEQKLQYTDFPLDELEVYCIDGVVLLKSEH